VNLDLTGGGFFMPLFVKLREGEPLDQSLVDKVKACMRKNYSARHIPDKIYQVAAIPYTLTGKKMEVPVRRILTGVPVERPRTARPCRTWTRSTFSSAMRANSRITGCSGESYSAALRVSGRKTV